MNSSLLPLLILFDLDKVLWPYWADSDELGFPCSRKNNEVINKKGDVIKCYPEVPAVFEKLKNTSIKLAVIKSCFLLKISQNLHLINMFGWNKYFSLTEMHENHVLDNLALIKQKSNVSYSNMIYFHKYEYDLDFKELGILPVHVDPTQGMTVKDLDGALEEYKLKQQKNKTDKSAGNNTSQAVGAPPVNDDKCVENNTVQTSAQCAT